MVISPYTLMGPARVKRRISERKVTLQLVRIQVR